MLPRWHIFLGAIFSLSLFFFFHLSPYQSSIVFLASFLIDFDHYLFFVVKTRRFNPAGAFPWYESLGKHHKPIMQIFHTIEFLGIIFVLSFFYQFFALVLIGMLFHSILDIVHMAYDGNLDAREFSLIKFLLSDKKKYL